MTLLTRVTAPVGYPVTLAQAKAQTRVDFDDEDTLMDALITAASDAVEDMSGRPLLTQTWRVATGKPERRVYLRAPVQAITSIQYYDATNTLQTADAADYLLISDDDRAWIEPLSGWPSLCDRADAFRVTFTAGYGAADDVPLALRQAILMLVAHFYEHREAVSDMSLREAPMAVEMLIGTKRVGYYG
jgi:uncharacterized phiE125 gp8 family phage protein